MKYELIETDFKINHLGVKLFRIRAKIEIIIWGVKPGDFGGYIQSEANLSQCTGNAWVSGNAQVFDRAWVSDNAQVSGNAWVSDNARVFGNAQVFDRAWVSDNAQVFDRAWVSDNAKVSGIAWVSGIAKVSGNAWVSGTARVSGTAKVEKFHQIKSVNNLKYSFTSLPKGVQIGCKFHSLKDWKNNHISIGKEHGMSEDLSKTYYNLMVAVRKVQRIEANELK